MGSLPLAHSYHRALNSSALQIAAEVAS